jgi:hypothetical protein
MIKTFRGKIVDGGQDTIVLHTNTGSTGYKIVKFQIIGAQPGTVTSEHTVKIYKTLQTTIDALVDFSDQTLLGVGFYSTNPSTAYTDTDTVIFDREIFNQDIYITHTETNAANAVNYYIELEQVKLDLNENTVATLKDIRNVTAP